MFQALHLCQCFITVNNLRELVTNSIMCITKIHGIVTEHMLEKAKYG